MNASTPLRTRATSALSEVNPVASSTDASTATGHVIALSELPETADTSDQRAAVDGGHPLHGVRIGLQVCVGEVRLTVGELLAARQHQVFVLDRSVDQPVDLVLEGRVVARGQLVAVDDRFALRVTELPLPLNA